MIHVCFCFSDKTERYSKFVGTSMLSIFENTSSPVTVHILHDNTLSQDNRNKLLTLVKSRNQLVKFYNIESLCADKLAAIKKFFPSINKTRYTFGAFYRLFIPTVLPADVSKAIYLDGDIIVTLDINELWQIELGEKIFGVVTEAENRVNAASFFMLCRNNVLKAEDYFNSGVILMNLDALRTSESTMTKGIHFLVENSIYNQFPYQDVLNYCFATQTLKLPLKFNMLVKNWRKINLEENKAIYHYAGGKSFGLDMRDQFHKLWMSYFVRTPFLDEETIGRLCSELLKFCTLVQKNAASLSSTVAGKNRAFFVDPEKIDALRKNFSIRDDEFLIIPGENEDSVQTLIDTMKTLKGRYVFFIMTKKLFKKNFPLDKLTKEGFVEGIDFIKGWEFLPENTSEFNSHQLVKTM